MDPPIRYARTDDGISIAYFTMGEGDPLVISPPLGWSHLQLELAYPELRAWYERLAECRTVVRFDWRGNGMSQRGLDPVAVPSDMGERDIEAVRSAIDAKQVDLMLCGAAGGWSAGYAVSHRERVRKLLLVLVPPDPNSGWGSSEVDAAISLADKDWVAFTETMAQAILGWESPQEAHAWAMFMRAAISEADFRVVNRQGSAAGGSPPPDPQSESALSAIRVPTIVLYPANARNLSSSAAQQTAALMSDGRLVLWRGKEVLPFGEDAVAAIESFLDEGRDAPPRAARIDRVAAAQSTSTSAGTPGSTAVILFADIAGSTQLTERLGDTAFRERSRALDVAIRDAVRASGGTPVEGKVMGDGVMSLFTSARDAIAAAIRCRDASAQHELGLHLGIHAGDVIREGDTAYGGAVNVAARICDACAPGEVLVSNIVRGLARTSADVAFTDRGEHALKGIDEPQRLWSVESR